jgi:MSHA pilin protein MshC
MSRDSKPENRQSAVHCALPWESGFTLIELIMVMVIMGVLAVYAAPRILNTGDFTARGFHDETLSLLRLAQKTAVVQRRVVCVDLNATGIALTIDTNITPDGACDGPVALPNTPRGGTGLSSSVASFKFTALGKTDQSAAITVSIANSTPITVEADTGYVHD